MKNLEKNIIESMQNSSDYQFNTDNFRLIVELSPDMIAILKDKKIVYINPSGIRLLGANSLEKLIGKSITDFIHPSYLEIENNRINQIQCLQDNNFIEEKFISLNGNVIDVELTSYPVNYQDDTFIQMYVREISHHKLIERELKSAEKRFKKLCEHMPNAIIIFDANGKLLDANKPLADISGYCRDELQNQNLFKLKLFSENEILKFVKFMLKATLDKPIGPDQFTLYHKNGNKILVEILAFKIRIKNQFLILNIIHDITKHVQLKEALSLSQKHLNAILHSSPDIIFILDDQLFIDEVYTSRSDLLWFSRESVLSSELNKILPEAAFVKIKDKLVSLNQTNTPISVEFTTKKNNI
ncbi:MAG: PAS domain S-box protein, partial [Spirochaetota bacterium]|nr:PAS domain S-box protein [Spirochaetota bacterium]